MAAESTFTFYTYSTGCTDDEPRWRNDGISDAFFLDIDDARRAVAELRREFANEPLPRPMTIHLEKIRTVPVTGDALLSLLNGDIASLVESYEIIESTVTDGGGPTPPGRSMTPS